MKEVISDFYKEKGFNMVLAFDFKKVKFDVDYYINPNWCLWDDEIAHIMEIVNEKINN